MILVFLLPIVGCEQKHVTVDTVELELKQNNYELLFVTKANISKKQEESYVDAILELRMEYDDSSKEESKKLTEWKQNRINEVQVFPTLIVLKGDQEITSVFGPKSKDEILETLSKTLIQ
ncbi:hypothetical protein RZN25_05075 [Bacillaceae bacterium S4-13-56]